MQVYIEYVLIDNLVIDYLLLKTTLNITATRTGRFRLILATVLGALAALTYPLISSVAVISVLVKILVGLTMVVIAVKSKTFRPYYLNSLIFLCLTFLTGGAIIGAFTIFNIDYSAEISIALMFLPVYAVIKGISSVVKHVYRQKEVISLVYGVEITLNGRTVKLKGFMDTGNGVYDNDRPVIVVEKGTAAKILGDFHSVPLKRITVRTVAGKRQNLAFEIDLIKIYIGDKVNIHNRVTVCVTPTDIGDGYDVILHPSLMGVSDDINYKKTQEVC